MRLKNKQQTNKKATFIAQVLSSAADYFYASFARRLQEKTKLALLSLQICW